MASESDSLLFALRGNETPTMAPINGLVGKIHMGVIYGVTVIVALIFLAVYIQLTLVICYGYKLVSYQTVFLFNILLWASFRLTFNSFYFYYCCELIYKASATSKWFLISFPEILLFLSLALLVHYFMELLIKVVERRQEVSYLNPSYKRVYYLRCLGSVLWASSLILFVMVNAIMSFLIFLEKIGETGRISRVVILECLILLMGTVLGICIILIYTTRAGKDIMEAKQVSKWQAVIISMLLIILFFSRAIYNIVAVALHKSHRKLVAFLEFATDLADYNASQEGNTDFFCVLLLWEVVPICLIVLFFRIRTPSSLKLIRRINSRSSLTQEISKHFFHGPSKSRNTSQSTTSDYHRSSHVSIPSLPGQQSQTFSIAGYGSTNRTHHSVPCSTSGYNPHSFMPGTTPPQLFTGSPSVFSGDTHINNNNTLKIND